VRKPQESTGSILERLNRPLLWTAIPAVGSFVALVSLTVRYDAFAVLVLGLLLAAALAMLWWPEMATLAVVGILYANLAALAVHKYGVNELVAGSVALVLGIPLAHFLLVQRQGLRIDRTFLLLLALLVCMLISSLFARNPGIALQRIGEFLLEGVALYFLVLNAIRNLTTLKRVMRVLMLTAALLGSLSLYQGITRSYGNEFWGLAQRTLELELAERTDSGNTQIGRKEPAVRLADRAGGPIGDPNRYAQNLMIVLPFAVFLFWDERRFTRRLTAVVAAGLILCGVLLTYSRGAFVTMVGLLVLMVFLRYIRPAHFLGAVVALLLLIAAAAPAYYKRMETMLGVQGLFAPESGARPDAVTRRRTTEMLAALKVFVDHPLFGVGPGQYMPFYAGTYQRSIDIALQHIGKPRRAHNLYFEMAAETGLVGLGMFLVIVFLLLRQLARARRRWARGRPDLANLATVFLFSLLAYLGTAVFLHLSFERYYWLLVALASVALRIGLQGEQGGGARRLVSSPDRAVPCRISH